MTTFVIPAGRQQVTYSNPAITVFDAVTNNPFFLSDWDFYRSSGESGTSTTLAYPCRITAAASPFTWNGGRFYGNIDANIDWDNFYEGGRFTLPSQFARFNSALLFPRNGVRGTFNDLQFGIRNDLNSGFVDGVRLNQAGDCTFNRIRVWCGRDDWLEADGANGRTHTINDSFFENLFMWLSGTGNIPNTFFFINNTLVHFRPWLFRGNLAHGAPLKVDSAAGSPKFRFNATTLVIGPSDYTDYGRMKNALRNTQATNGCRLLVLGGRHVDRELIGLYENAGFSVLEDGAGDSATVEWQNRKAAFLNEGPPVTPPVVQSLTSPVAISTIVGTKVLPTLKGFKFSGTNSDVSSFVGLNPAYDPGDLVFGFVMNDGSASRTGTPRVVGTADNQGPNGEPVTWVNFAPPGEPAQIIFDDGNSGNNGHSMACFRFVAAATRALDAGITVAISGGTSAVEQFTVGIAVFTAGTFDPAAPVMHALPTFSTTSILEARSAAFTAKDRLGFPIFVASRAFDMLNAAAPTGWTFRERLDPGALASYCATRNAGTTRGEAFAAASFAGPNARPFVGATIIINGGVVV